MENGQAIAIAKGHATAAVDTGYLFKSKLFGHFKY
jgi:hypothetical protein